MPAASYTLVSVVWMSKGGLDCSLYERAALNHPGRRSGPAWRSDNWRGMISPSAFIRLTCTNRALHSTAAPNPRQSRSGPTIDGP